MYKTFAAVLFIAAAILVSRYAFFTGAAVAAEIKTVDQIYHNKVIPGVTPAADALKAMGEHKKKRSNPDKTTSYIYDERRPGYPDEMTVSADGASVVHLAVAVLDSTECNISDIKKVLGEPERTGFSMYAFYLRVHAYPKHGFIFITNEAGGLFEKQYIKKCSLREFEETFGKNFPKENPYKM